MNWTDLNLVLATPEIVLLIGLCAVLLIDLWLDDNSRYITHFLSIGVLLAAACGQLAVWRFEPEIGFNGMYVADGVAQLAKIAVYLGTAALFVYSKSYNQVCRIFKGEYYFLGLFATVGMSIMISSGHFLPAYIGLELLSLSLYAMIALQRDSAKAAEAALKYFVLGALASGLLLYGVSLVYGATGSLEFARIFEVASAGAANGWLLKLGVLLIVAAIAFKFGAVPFHMWVPDVYQGAPTSVAGMVGSMPKIAATVFAFRILVSAFAVQKGDWQLMFASMAAISLLIGNLAAIMQTNIKRMFAYSTISHMGFILMAYVGGILGIQAAVYYAVAYVVMSLAGFGVLMLLSTEQRECENISDLAGLNQRNAWYAFLMLLVMFSMAGIPPLMGFYAKFYVLKALVAAQYPWAIVLAVFAVVMSLIGAFYYLRVVRVMYMEDKTTDEPIAGDLGIKLFLSANGLLLLVFGLFPDFLMEAIKKAVETTF